MRSGAPRRLRLGHYIAVGGPHCGKTAPSAHAGVAILTNAANLGLAPVDR